MYKLQGMRLKGIEIDREYTDLNVAKFEFDVTKCVSSYLVLYKAINGSDELEQLDIFVKS